MKLGVLYSGGKDSNYAMFLASKEHEISCLINLKSENQDSYMFQSAGNGIIDLQSKSLEIPLIKFETKGEKEDELEDLRLAISKAVDEYNIEGIVTGAIESTYQASRIQKICSELDLWCFNPLWKIDENKYLEELEKNNFDVIILKIAAYPLTKDYIGKKLTPTLFSKLASDISIIGEGGEFESLVLNSPMIRNKIEIIDSEIKMDSKNSGELIVKEVK